MEEVDAGHKIKGVRKRPREDFAPIEPLAQHNRRGMTMKAIGNQQAVVDTVDGDGWKPIP